MTPARAYYYDGKTSRRAEVELTVGADGVLVIKGQGLERTVVAKEIQVPAQIARQRPMFFLADGAKCELLDDLEIRTLFPGRQRIATIVHRLENRLWYLLAAVVLAVVVVWASVVYGVPALARQAAFMLPEDTATSLGEQTLEWMDGSFLKPSALPESRRAELMGSFQSLMGDRRYRVEFRAAGKDLANAFALPSGVIVFTDEMVNLAEDDRELLGVLAHEIGHVELRHGLRQVLQNSITALLLVMFTGDVSAASSFAAALPVVLVQAKFSRESEIEADDYAAALLREHGLDPTVLAAMLRRLESRVGPEGEIPEFFSTHPATEERIGRLTRSSPAN